MKAFWVAAVVALAAGLAANAARAGQTFDTVKARGQVNCGVNTGLAGFAKPDDRGIWRGIDVDVCRAIAAAMFGNAERSEEHTSELQSH